jgi:lysozyme
MTSALNGIEADLLNALEKVRALKHEPTPEVTLTDPNDKLLVSELLRDEGFVPHAYQDSLGFWTIGIGRLIDKRKGGGITRAEAEMLKANDIARFRRELDKKLPWWRQLDPVRQRVIQNMAFNLGVDGLLTFKNTLKSIQAGNYADAANRMLASRWAKQVKGRADRLASMMRTGDHHERL